MENKVVLLGTYGGDESHCLSAWQSTNVELGLELPHEVQDRISALYQETVVLKKKSPLELLKMLAEHGHHTPFEKSCLHFQITGDIASHIHCLKHRIATSINGESARYKELLDKWYIPGDWKEAPVDQEVAWVGEHIELLGTNTGDNWASLLEDYTKLGHHLYHKANESLSPKLGRKRAKESSRYFLTYNKQLDFDIMFNFRSFQNFYGLRGSGHAQVEIDEIANKMLGLVQELPQFSMTLGAFGLNA